MSETMRHQRPNEPERPGVLSAVKRRVLRLWHRAEHRMGWNTGRVVTWWADGELWVGFQCDSCHRLTGVDRVPDHVVYPERR